jgi:hypothetical protein
MKTAIGYLLLNLSKFIEHVAEHSPDAFPFFLNRTIGIERLDAVVVLAEITTIGSGYTGLQILMFRVAGRGRSLNSD